jgi:hypothetical protein
VCVCVCVCVYVCVAGGGGGGGGGSSRIHMNTTFAIPCAACTHNYFCPCACASPAPLFAEKFDPGNVFSAVQLLRSFAESTLTFEEDAYVASTQCAAAAAGFEWVHHSDPLVEIFENTAVLRGTQS